MLPFCYHNSAISTLYQHRVTLLWSYPSISLIHNIHHVATSGIWGCSLFLDVPYVVCSLVFLSNKIKVCQIWSKHCIHCVHFSTTINCCLNISIWLALCVCDLYQPFNISTRPHYSCKQAFCCQKSGKENILKISEKLSGTEKAQLSDSAKSLSFLRRHGNYKP